MPELPEVQRVVDTLRPMLEGRRFDSVAHVRPDMLTPAGVDLSAKLAGRWVRSVWRRAKRINIELDDDSSFFIHLGMTGTLCVVEPTCDLRPHTHLVASLDDGRQLRLVDPRRFGEIRWLGEVQSDAGLGPEPLSLRAAVLGRRLAGTRRSIKTALLDQRVVAGVGNIYADESLFASNVHPLTRACDLSAGEVAGLCRSLKRVLRQAIEAGGSSLRDYVDAAGRPGSFQHRHRVYDKAGQPCERCGNVIQRIVVGGRSTCFCEACQRKPTRRRVVRPHHESTPSRV